METLPNGTLPSAEEVAAAQAPTSFDPAVDPCDRCGTFAPLRQHADRRLCGDCLRRRHPIETSPLDARHVIGGVLQLLSSIGLTSAALVFTANLPITFLSYAVEVPIFVENLYALLAVTPVNAAIMAMAWDVVVERRPASLRRAFTLAGRRYGACVGTTFLGNLVTGIGLVMCLVPGLYLAVALTLLLPLTLFEGRSGTSALGASMERMKGHLGPALAGYLLWSLPFLLAFAAFLVLAVGIGAATDPAALDALETSPVMRGAEAGFALFAVPLLVPAQLVPMVVYAKLRVSGGEGWWV